MHGRLYFGFGKIGLDQKSAWQRTTKAMMAQSTGPKIPRIEQSKKEPHVRSLPRESHSIDDVPATHQTGMIISSHIVILPYGVNYPNPQVVSLCPDFPFMQPLNKEWDRKIPVHVGLPLLMASSNDPHVVLTCIGCQRRKAGL